MELKVGDILEGRVTGITKFGAFVTVTAGKSGLVHISEIANTYVSDVGQFLNDGQEVKVKVIGIDDSGRLNLSIKKATGNQDARAGTGARSGKGQTQSASYEEERSLPEKSFEDKLKQFMQDSESKIAGIRQYEKKPSRKRGGQND